MVHARYQETSQLDPKPKHTVCYLLWINTRPPKTSFKAKILIELKGIYKSWIYVSWKKESTEGHDCACRAGTRNWAEWKLAFSQKDKEAGEGNEFLGKVGRSLCFGDGQMDGRPPGVDKYRERFGEVGCRQTLQYLVSKFTENQRVNSVCFMA